MTTEKIFIKNTLKTTDVNILKGTTTYTVIATYAIVDLNGEVSIEQKPVTSITFTWQQMIEAGGILATCEKIKKDYNI